MLSNVGKSLIAEGQPPEEAGDADRVIDPAVPDHRRDLTDRGQLDGDLLAGVEVGLRDPSGVADDDRVDVHAQQRRIGPEGAEAFRRIARIAGLFQELARAGEAGVLPGFREPARRLQAVPPRTGAELPHQDDFLFGGHGDDVHPIGQMRHEEIVSLAAPSRPEPLATESEEPGLGQRLVVGGVAVGNP